MRDKKGQITWFIIIGIIILLGVITITYIRQTTEKGIIEQVPVGREVRHEGEQEIRNFVDSCLKPIALQGLELQRLQAGYIEIPAGRDTLTIDKGNDAPFWITKYGIAIPSKEFMESELEYYITKELDKCIGNFKQFSDMGYKIEKEVITTNVSFANSVWVNVNLPLTVIIHGLTYKINDFNIEIPINMELIYNIASDLALYEELYAYLEGFTLDLISKYQWVPGSSKGGTTYLPPKIKTDASFGCSQTTWVLNEVWNDLRRTYNSKFKYLKIANTNFEKEIGSTTLEQGTLDSYIYNFFTEQYPTVHVDYIYDLDWFFNLDILPKSGNTIKPERTIAAGIPMVGRFCTFKYKFNYFYDFPVLLKIKDDSSAKIDPVSNTFKKEGGYEFQIPLWVFVCGNQERECTGRARTYNITPTLEETDFCKDSQKLSGDIKITVEDNNTPLEGVDVFYVGTSSLQNCFTGRTSSDGTMTSKFPLCSACSIQLYKEGYSSYKQRFDILDNQSKQITFELKPFVNLTVNAKLIRIPIFVRSWHETDRFTNPDKMIELVKKIRPDYDTSTLSRDLSGLINNRALMAILKGEIDLNPSYDDKMMITGKGLDQFFYIYPDPEYAKLKLGTGIYKVNLITTGNVTITKTDYGYGAVMDEFKNTYSLGPDLEYQWYTGDLKDKKLVTFYSLVEYASIELNPANWFKVDDNIIQNGTMKAELLYEAPDCVNYTFIDINGRVRKDFTPAACRQVINVDITESEYIPYIMPELR